MRSLNKLVEIQRNIGKKDLEMDTLKCLEIYDEG